MKKFILLMWVFFLGSCSMNSDESLSSELEVSYEITSNFERTGEDEDEETAGSLKGKVTLNGIPQNGILVDLEGEDLLEHNYTDEEGEYFFDELPSGDYLLITASGTESEIVIPIHID